MARKYPPKTGKCAISHCSRGRTDWHHIISQAQIIKRGLPESMFTDPGNLQELCRYHHDMTTASISRRQLTKKHGPISRRKNMIRSVEEKRAARAKRREARAVKGKEGLPRR